MPPRSPSAQAPLLAVKRDIETMKTRGAGEIGKQAAAALAAAGQTYKGDSMPELRAVLTEAGRLLASARPTAVTLRNGLNTVLNAVDEATTVEDAQRRLLRAAESYALRVDAARREIADLALQFFKDGDVVLTHCHSTAAGGAISHAAAHRQRIRAFSTETRPFRQGLIQAPALAQKGVDTTLIVDSAVAHVLENEDVTQVVVGADTIAADGSLYNKIGTHQVALLAHHFRIPFIVCAERDKFSPYPLDGEPVQIEERAVAEIADPATVPGVKIRNPVFDRTPPDLIEVYVTDRGLVKPKDVRKFIQQEFGATKPWI